jgi:uncharacterized protein involved in copper resistance
MKLTRPLALGVATAAMVAVPVATAAPALAADQAPDRAQAPRAQVAAAQGPGSVDLISGYLGVANQILDIVVAQVETDDNREGWLQALQNAAWYQFDESKNVMVIKADQYQGDLQGVQLDAVYKYPGLPDMRVLVFDSGSVTNTGDGGYINWAFQGWWDRPSDTTVNFRQP